MPYLTTEEAQRITLNFARSIERKAIAQNSSPPQTCAAMVQNQTTVGAANLLFSQMLTSYNVAEQKKADLITQLDHPTLSQNASITLATYGSLERMTSGNDPIADPTLYALKMIAMLSCLFPKEAVEASQEITPLNITDQILELFGAHTDHPDS